MWLVIIYRNIDFHNLHEYDCHFILFLQCNLEAESTVNLLKIAKNENRVLKNQNVILFVEQLNSRYLFFKTICLINIILTFFFKYFYYIKIIF